MSNGAGADATRSVSITTHGYLNSKKMQDSALI